MRDEREIEKLILQLIEKLDESEGRCLFPGMTYSEGVRNALEWVLDEEETDSPIE